MNSPILTGQVLNPYTWQEVQRKLGLHLHAPMHARRASPTSAAYKNGSHLVSELMSRQCQDGDRTEHLLKLAGALFAKQFSLDDCINMCLQWNSRNIEPLDVQKIEATCVSVHAADLRNHPQRHGGEPAKPSMPFYDLADGRIDRYLTTSPPKRRWLIKDLVTLGKAAAVIAPGGSSKSQWLLQLAVGVATGIPVADHWEIGETGSVIVFFAEDDEDEIHRRLERITYHLQMSGQGNALQGLEDHLFIFSTIGRDMLLTRRSLSGEVITTDIVDNVASLAEKVPDLKLIIIDPAARFRGGEENSNEDATRFVEALESLAKATGASVMIAHHTNKGSYSADGEQSQGASRGASALTDGLRWQMNLSPASEAVLKRHCLTPNNLRKYVMATVTKTNYSAFPESVLMERMEGGYLSAVSIQTARKRAESAAIAAVLRAISSHGKPISARGLEEQYAGVHKALQMPKERVREVIQTAIARGLMTGGARKPIALTPLGQSAIPSPVTSIAGIETAAVAPVAAKTASRKERKRYQ